MWDKKDLEAKLRYLNDLLKNAKDKDKKYKIFNNRVAIIEMLELLDGRKIKIYNSPLWLSTTKLSLKREKKQYDNNESVLFNKYKEDLKFAFILCKNIALLQPFEWQEEHLSKSKEECIMEVIDFAKTLQDEELKKDIINIAKDTSHIALFDNLEDEINVSGRNYRFPIFKECYISCSLNSSTLLHEIVHTIDAKNKDYYENSYPYSYEVPSYALQIYKSIKEVNLNNEINILIYLCKRTMSIISGKSPSILLPRTTIENYAFENITNKSLTSIELLLTLKSILIGTIFAKKILDNEEEGLREYKEMIGTKFPKDELPDYSRWGITNEVIIDYSKNLTSYFSEYQKERGGKSL